jgi:hypothetical protein
LVRSDVITSDDKYFIIHEACNAVAWPGAAIADEQFPRLGEAGARGFGKKLGSHKRLTVRVSCGKIGNLLNLTLRCEDISVGRDNDS